jgi:hypothetical protein
MATLQDSKLIYTPAPAPKQKKKGAKIPKFLQENDSVAPVTSSTQEFTNTEEIPVIEKKETVKEMVESAKINIDQSIDLKENPDLFADDGEVPSDHPGW